MQYHNSQHLAPVIRPPYHKFGDRPEVTLFPELSSEQMVIDLIPGVTTIERIQREVCRQYDISLTAMLSRSRYPRFVKPRHIAMTRCIKETGRTYEEVGYAFNRHHTSVINAFKKYKDRV